MASIQLEFEKGGVFTARLLEDELQEIGARIIRHGAEMVRFSLTD